MMQGSVALTLTASEPEPVRGTAGGTVAHVKAADPTMVAFSLVSLVRPSTRSAQTAVPEAAGTLITKSPFA